MTTIDPNTLSQQQQNSVSGTSTLQDILGGIDIGPTNSIQFMWAKVQLAQSQICKDSAMDYLNQIENIQSEQEEVAEMISQARKLQDEAKTSGKTVEMPAEMVTYFEKHNLSWNTQGNDNLHYEDEWTYNIQSLTNYQDSISNKTQTLMVFLQDYISQYNSYLQGASSAINEASQVATSILTR